MLTEIIYEDKDILVAHKPAGLAVQTARVGQADVVSELKNYLGRAPGATGTKNAAGNPGRRQEPYLGIIHRLDQPVEGLLVFAKNKQAAASLAGQLQEQGEEGTFCKHYYGVLCGIPAAGEGKLSDYLYKQAVKNGSHTEYQAVVVSADPGSQSRAEDYFGSCPGDRHAEQRISTAAMESGRARWAVLDYRVLEVWEEKGLALADITIETGRFHQIRAQMAHAGIPLLGDMKYGGEQAKAAAQALNIRNVALCAYHLEFAHPASGKRMDFRVPPENPAFSFFSQF